MTSWRASQKERARERRVSHTAVLILLTLPPTWHLGQSLNSAGMLQLMSTVLVDFFVGLFTWIYHGTFLPN